MLSFATMLLGRLVICFTAHLSRDPWGKPLIVSLYSAIKQPSFYTTSFNCSQSLWWGILLKTHIYQTDHHILAAIFRELQRTSENRWDFPVSNCHWLFPRKSCVARYSLTLCYSLSQFARHGDEVSKVWISSISHNVLLEISITCASFQTSSTSTILSKRLSSFPFKYYLVLLFSDGGVCHFVP